MTPDRGWQTWHYTTVSKGHRLALGSPNKQSAIQLYFGHYSNVQYLITILFTCNMDSKLAMMHSKPADDFRNLLPEWREMLSRVNLCAPVQKWVYLLRNNPLTIAQRSS